MNDETYEALKEVMTKTGNMASKLDHKRKNQEEIWFFATLLRDMQTVNYWISKEEERR